MIPKKVVDRYAHQSGVKDQLVAEREVVLTYALRALHDRQVLNGLAFKGGTCLRKIVFGSTGRFSEDLDFTLTAEDSQAVLSELYEVFNRDHYGVSFSLDDWYETDDGFGMEVEYHHEWNDAGRFRLQVSSREKPTLPVTQRPLLDQIYFEPLEFTRFQIPSLATIEMASEKVRAAFQRAKVRDLYDLHLLGDQKLDLEVLRRLVVLKLWQVRDPFEPGLFFQRLRGQSYDWNDLRRLTRGGVDKDRIIAEIEYHYGGLQRLTDLEQQVISDARSGWNAPLADRLRTEVLALLEPPP